jgi:predicted transcriptional regulator
MATETKITKAMVLDMILEACADNEAIVAYCENEKVLLENKKVKAAARAQAKKEAGDDLRAVIQTILEEATEPMTREMVLDCIEGAEEMDLTAAKVGARISQLVQLGLASKTTVKTEDGKSKVAYVWGTANA